MQTHNNSGLTLREITETCPYLGQMVNDWRERRIDLYAHPTDPALLLSVGTAFNQTTRVIAVEPRSAFTTALEYIAQGKVYHAH